MGNLRWSKKEPNKRNPTIISCKDIPYVNAEINDIPEDQYLSPNPYCDKIPEILNIYS